jgi:hypothetical protein
MAEQMIIAILWFYILWFFNNWRRYLSFYGYSLMVVLRPVVRNAEAVGQICHESALATFRDVLLWRTFRLGFFRFKRGLNIQLINMQSFACMLGELASLGMRRNRFSRRILPARISAAE